MKHRILKVASGLVLLTCLSCATGLNSTQTAEYKTWEANGTLVEEKSELAGALWGLLPGGGSFYTRNYGLGIVNLLFWPLSILWDPVSGMRGAQEINYAATRASVEAQPPR